MFSHVAKSVPNLAGAGFLPLGTNHVPRWRRFALRRRGELGGPQGDARWSLAGVGQCL